MYLIGKKIISAAHSSRVIARVRSIFQASFFFNIVVTVVRSLRIPLAAIERSLQGRAAHDQRVEDDHTMTSIANRSVVAQTLERLVVVPVIAWRGGRLGVLSEFLAQLELSDRVRLTGVCLSAVLVAQTIAVSVAGVSIHLLGWGVRCGLVLICLLLCLRPRLVAAAWTARWHGAVRRGLQSQSRNSG
jgi:hypothetical protein